MLKSVMYDLASVRVAKRFLFVLELIVIEDELSYSQGFSSFEECM